MYFLLSKLIRWRPRADGNLFLQLFFLLRQQLDDAGGRHRDMMSALGENIVITRLANRHIFQVGQGRFQRQGLRDRRIVEIALDLANLV